MPTLQEILDGGLCRDAATGRPLFPGGVAVVLHAGRVAESAVAGEALRYPDDSGVPLPAGERIAMTADTLFDVASLTKLFTATVLLRLVADGVLDLDRPIGETFPEWRYGERAVVTLRHLLTHTSGLPAHARLWTVPPDARRHSLLTMPLEAAPGSVFTYSCLGYITAGWLAEAATGTGLAELLADIVTRPLGLADTGYGPVPPARCAATEYEPYVDRGMVRGGVHDENSWCLGGRVGNAGIFSTASDLGRFAEFLRGDGSLDGVRVLPPDLAATMQTDQLPAGIDPGYRAGFGPRIGDASFMGRLAASGALGHTGFTGTSIVVDRARELSVILCTNRVHPNRDWSLLGATRCAVADRALDLAGEIPHGSPETLRS